MAIGEKNDRIIVSTSFGAGKIVGTQKFTNNADEFTVIESLENNVKTFIGPREKNKYRHLSQALTIKEVLDSMHGSRSFAGHDSKKERIAYLKERAKVEEIFTIANTIKEIYTFSDRGNAEEKILTDLINTLALEISMVLEVTQEQAREQIIAALNGEKHEF